MKARRAAALFGFAAGALLVSGCKSHHVDMTLENRTGAVLEQMEIDYPSASFGTNALAPGAILHYRVQVRGAGAVIVQYSLAGGKTVHASGPELREGQDGELRIVLEPGGQVDFEPRIKP